MDQEKTSGGQWKSLWLKIRRRVMLFGSLLAAVVVMLVIWGPDGATYEEYLRLEEGMSRQEVVDIIGQGDYWFHQEGDLEVTSWVNEDGTFIRAVFDKADKLVEVSWESGWKPEREAE